MSAPTGFCGNGNHAHEFTFNHALSDCCNAVADLAIIDRSDSIFGDLRGMREHYTDHKNFILTDRRTANR